MSSRLKSLAERSASALPGSEASLRVARERLANEIHAALGLNLEASTEGRNCALLQQPASAFRGFQEALCGVFHSVFSQLDAEAALSPSAGGALIELFQTLSTSTVRRLRCAATLASEALQRRALQREAKAFFRRRRRRTHWTYTRQPRAALCAIFPLQPSARWAASAICAKKYVASRAASRCKAASCLCRNNFKADGGKAALGSARRLCANPLPPAALSRSVSERWLNRRRNWSVSLSLCRNTCFAAARWMFATPLEVRPSKPSSVKPPLCSFQKRVRRLQAGRQSSVKASLPL